MATKLKNLKITKVALVDEGACSEAHINLFKRRNQEMGFEEILKGLSEEQQTVVKNHMAGIQQQVSDANGNLAKSKAELDTVKADLEKAKKDFEEFKAENDKKEEEEDEDAVMKSASPALRAILEKAKSQAKAAELIAKKMADEAAEKEALAKAKTLTAIPAKEEELVGLHKSLNGVKPEVANQVFDILEKAQALINKSAAFEGKGTEGDAGAGASLSTDDAWGAIEKAAEPLAKSRNITKEAAINAVLSEQPELYKNYLATMR